MTGTRITVLGAGYVGLVTGGCLARFGHVVTMHDVDAGRLVPIAQGRAPFHEPGLGEVVKEGNDSGRLRAAESGPIALASAEIAIVAVGTPAAGDGSADLQFLHAAVEDVARHAAAGAVLVLRSTVPPGTGDGIAARLQAAGRSDICVVNAPEFLAEGTAVKDFFAPGRLVFGGPRAAAERVAGLWHGVPDDVPRFFTNRPTAELAKYASNTFLAARVALINEMARLSDHVGADVRDLAAIVGSDHRIGNGFLRSGIGYGGSCFPKDVEALAVLADREDIFAPIVAAVTPSNEGQRQHVLDACRELLGSLDNRRISLLGIAFKPGTDDTRQSPALWLAHRLVAAGADVHMHDPVAAPPFDLAHLVTTHDTAIAAAEDTELIILVTEWPEYQNLDWSVVAAAMRSALLLDARNTLDWHALQAAGFQVWGVGAQPGAKKATRGEE